jgi:hypothetical protein
MKRVLVDNNIGIDYKENTNSKNYLITSLAYNNLPNKCGLDDFITFMVSPKDVRLFLVLTNKLEE